MWGPSEFKALGTLKNYDQVKKLSKIKVPTLFLCGQHDEATPLTVKKYSRRVKQSRFKEIKGASHAILMEKPKPLLKEVDQFLFEVES